MRGEMAGCRGPCGAPWAGQAQWGVELPWGDPSLAEAGREEASVRPQHWPGVGSHPDLHT